jgi:GxxExxY protein
MHGDLTQKIIGVFYEVYNELGHGFLESVYQSSLEIALISAGLEVRHEIEIPVWFRRQRVGDFSADLLVNQHVLIELKAVRTLNEAHHAQLLNYLRGTDVEVGLLLDFGIKPEFKRLVFDNQRKQIREKPRVDAE